MESQKILNWKESVLNQPDVYIGASKDIVKSNITLLENDKFETKKCMINLGAINCIREIFYNAVDQKWRETPKNKLTYIRVIFDSKDRSISIENDGPPITIQKHNFEYKDPTTGEVLVQKLFPPEAYFGRFLSGTNYEKNKTNIKTSGKNGMGAKVVNVLSKRFEVECSDGKKVFYQNFTDHSNKASEPIITQSTKKYIKIKFWLDYEYFNFYDSKIISNFLEKLCIDSSYITEIPIYYNEKVYSINFNNYVSYYGILPESPCMEFKSSKKDSFDYLIRVIDSPNINSNFCSFVNGMAISDEGTEIKQVRKEITNLICDLVNKRFKLSGELEIKSKDIKGLFYFIQIFRSDVMFSSQTKDKVTTAFKFNFKLGSKNEQELEKFKFYEEIQALISKKSIKNVDLVKSKIDDARLAGTQKSKDCILFIVEGLSAKAFVVDGLAYLPYKRDVHGVFPIKGKFLNASKASTQKLYTNKEVQQLKVILGINSNIDYKKNSNSLRYGQIRILTDEDYDGIHIRGLILNYIYKTNPTLFDIGFVNIQSTPIVRIYYENTFLSLYTTNELDQILSTLKAIKKVKYYKGLASHNQNEVKDSFTANQVLTKMFLTNQCIKIFQDVFDKGHEDDRKDMIIKALAEADKKIENLGIECSCTEFLQEHLNREYQKATQQRHLPNFYDGLVVSRRKILYTILKFNSKDEIKVERLAGKVSDFTQYHHGAVSLGITIKKLAQNYVGSNNIPLFIAEGQFGTRTENGEDGGHPRYISVRLNPFFKKLYFEESILEYNYEEGLKTEPKQFYPPIPFYFLNGVLGIPSGFKSEIPSYNIKELIDQFNKILNNETVSNLVPYFEGFKGEVELGPDYYITNGLIIEVRIFEIKTSKSKINFSVLEQLKKDCVVIIADKSTANQTHLVLKSRISEQKLKTVLGLDEIKIIKEELKTYEVLEIPVGVSINNFKVTLATLNKNGDIVALNDQSGNNDIQVTFKSHLSIQDLFKLLKLSKKTSLKNLVVLKNGIPTLYKEQSHLAIDFVKEYLKILAKRKYSKLLELNLEVKRLTQKMKFILQVRNGDIDIKTTSEIIINRLKELGYEELENDKYKHLVSLPIESIFKDNVDKMKMKIDEYNLEIKYISETSESDMYKNDLKNLLI